MRGDRGQRPDAIAPGQRRGEMQRIERLDRRRPRQILRAFEHAGIELPRTSRAQAQEGQEVDADSHIKAYQQEIRQKILDIICKEWPTPDGYLLGFDIYERLRSQGVEVTHDSVNTVLSGLASSGWCLGSCRIA